LKTRQVCGREKCAAESYGCWFVEYAYGCWLVEYDKFNIALAL